MRTLDIEFERDWSVGLGAPLGDDHIEFFFFFSVSGIFRDEGLEIFSRGAYISNLSQID